MSDLQLILLILAVAVAVWQIVLAGMGIALMSNPKTRNVKVGFLPGILAVILFIAVVLVG